MSKITANTRAKRDFYRDCRIWGRGIEIDKNWEMAWKLQFNEEFRGPSRE